VDKEGIIPYANEEIVAGFTVGAAWSGLRKSWVGYKVARRLADDYSKVLYARRIIFNCRMLNIPEPYFSELDHDDMVTRWPGSSNP
jgi:hypothetical protein